MRILKVLGVLALSCASVSCDRIAGVNGCEGPFVQTVEPERAGLDLDANPDSLVVVDVYFTPDHPARQPAMEQVELVRGHGGTVRHVFHVEAVRTQIPIGGLRDLWDGHREVVSILTVPDPDRHTVLLLVRHDEDLEITHFFESLGGVVRFNYSIIPAIAGWIGDTAIPCLVASDWVEYIQHPHDRIYID